MSARPPWVSFARRWHCCSTCSNRDGRASASTHRHHPQLSRPFAYRTAPDSGSPFVRIRSRAISDHADCGRQGWRPDALVQEEHPTGRRPVRRSSDQIERKVTAMATTLKDFVAERPVDRGRVEEHKERMPSEVRARIPHTAAPPEFAKRLLKGYVARRHPHVNSHTSHQSHHRKLLI